MAESSDSDPRSQENGSVEESHAHKFEHPKHRRLPFRQWVETNMNWSWFTCTQSTGGIASLLYACPKRFDGLDTIGTIIFIFNIVLFLTFTTLMAIRWTGNPSKIRDCFIKAPECYFFGSFWLTCATMIIDMQQYGVPHTGPWLLVAIRICFWTYAAITLVSTTLHLTFLIKYTPVEIHEFNPAIFLLVLNAMLTGTVAAIIAADQPPAQRLPIIVAGVAYQGLGWTVCTFFLNLLIARLLAKGWPNPPHTRQGLFIMVGTSGYTIVALIGLARATNPLPYGYFNTHPMAGEVLLIVATWFGVFLWVFTFWVFSLASCINLFGLFIKEDRKNLKFGNVAWSLVFPVVGFTLSTVYLGEELESQGILWVSVGMTIMVISFWLLDLALMAKTIVISMFLDPRVKLS
ncbi:related to C4-dicarboxylate transport protein mae1 [Ramularia collo-cygni]|uniref:Related to C4-dicarboxylate transport protein mae1 n=1 Tax=Ramularia collo-cygni TaxID=112498 RepID=A0A2D3V1S3_9PEZI|nr:related to C4-dicarboxylate transport protein mae1 [Ramularia collo-cygni]CZT14183.1 related to C4-dicarboxylate transport protein mae1 [Ramularia collo-cygni]